MAEVSADESAVPTRALAAVSEALVGAAASDLSLDTVLERLVHAARDLVGARYAALGVPDGDGGFARFLTAGMSDELIESLGPLPRTHGLLDAMLSQPAPYRTPDIRSDQRFRGWWPSKHPQMRSFLGYPIVFKGDVIGAFYLTDKEGAPAFDETDEHLVGVFARHAAVLVEYARLYEQSRELSVAGERNRIARELHDALTQTLFGARLAVQTANLALTSIVASRPDPAPTAGDANGGAKHARHRNPTPSTAGHGPGPIDGSPTSDVEHGKQAGDVGQAVAPLEGSGPAERSGDEPAEGSATDQADSTERAGAQSVGSGPAMAESAGTRGGSGAVVAAVEQLGRASALLEEAFGELRALILDLRPPNLATDRLGGAVRKQLALLERTSDLTVDLHIDDDAEVAEPETERQLFRIVQEAVANVVRHATAQSLTVSISVDEPESGDAGQVLRLDIRDDGTGFDPSERAIRSRRLGLTSMLDRAQALGGRLTIDSSPGAGTLVRAEVPVG